jgi:aspartyl-tRNA(Asn)/glutamyl-tRNA(Gln) amidotransferase subunit B
VSPSLAAPGVEAVIGLEIHLQLRTRAKMFCGNAAEFGAEPNTHVCPVCLGLPGSLPTVNGQAVELAVRAALGLQCRVHPRSAFDRKHYFYPDLPKGYQITQHRLPLATGGFLELPLGEGAEPRRIGIRRVHLEEDAGKLLHDRLAGATAIDLNRAGVPLAEIVTEPDLRTPEEARALLVRLRQALQYLEVSDCNMEEGSLRVDANVSLRAPGRAPGPRTEVKNLNSFANVERALRFEIRRQARLGGEGKPVEGCTLLWDAGLGEARPLRTKEQLHDYRYLPEPDLPPLQLGAAWLEEMRRGLPEMPWDRADRLRRDHGLPGAHAEQLSATRELADYFEAVVAEGAAPREAASWVMGEVLATLNAAGGTLRDAVPPRSLARLLAPLAAGQISRAVARRLFSEMMRTGAAPDGLLAGEELSRVSDPETIRGWVRQALAEHPAEAERLRAGETRLHAFFVGQVMRRSGDRADPQRVREALREEAER